MSGDLAIALALFAGSAVAIIFFGSMLAKFGDALATLTGWGRLFVGSILVALVTSLPELLTNISAVRLDPPNPDLALGDVLGSNMVNMFILAVVALLFGGKRLLEQVSPEQGYLVVLAAIMTGMAILFGAVKMEVSLWQIGLSSVIILVLYVVGMRIVYVTRPRKENGDEKTPGITLRRAWLMFGLASLGVVAAAPVLAYSSDQIAEITGVASSTLGILAVALVTSMPEVSATVASRPHGGHGPGGWHTVRKLRVQQSPSLFYADPFYRDGILTNQLEPAHFVAGSVALGLILAGLVLILSRNRLKRIVAAGGLALMAAVYLAGAVVVATLGAAEEDDTETPATVRYQGPPPPAL